MRITRPYVKPQSKTRRVHENSNEGIIVTVFISHSLVHVKGEKVLRDRRVPSVSKKFNICCRRSLP